MTEKEKQLSIWLSQISTGQLRRMGDQEGLILQECFD